MIMLSLNIRGVGGSLKLASMHRLLSKTKPHVIFLPETLPTDERARDSMYALRIGCHVQLVWLVVRGGFSFHGIHIILFSLRFSLVAAFF
jgi:hypothetical protein